MSDQSLYHKLFTTASAWVTCTLPKTPDTNEVDYERIESMLSPDAKIEWGHAFFVSHNPPLRGSKSPSGFLDHMRAMTPHLGTWTIEIADVCIDVGKRSAVVRADFHMRVEVGGEAVRNEILFWVEMDEEGTKILKSTEFIDPVASGRLRELMMAKAASAGGGKET